MTKILKNTVNYSVLLILFAGEECMRYIRVGNALHKVCVLSGVTALGMAI